MELGWLDEKVEKTYKNNWVYRSVCFLIGRKLTFKEMLIILKRINEGHLGDEESKNRSLDEVLKIYRLQNGKYPEGIFDDES